MMIYFNLRRMNSEGCELIFTSSNVCTPYVIVTQFAYWIRMTYTFINRYYNNDNNVIAKMVIAGFANLCYW